MAVIRTAEGTRMMLGLIRRFLRAIRHRRRWGELAAAAEAAADRATADLNRRVRIRATSAGRTRDRSSNAAPRIPLPPDA